MLQLGAIIPRPPLTKVTFMGEVEIVSTQRQIVVKSVCYFYGDAASEPLAAQVASDIAQHWNEPRGVVVLNNVSLQVVFNVDGQFAPALLPEEVMANTDPKNNYFRIETFAGPDISFVDGIGSNTGYFKLDNLLHNSTTAAHEYGHTIGLEHPSILDLRGAGQPGIMYPRGTLVDSWFQYDPAVPPGAKGGTINPFKRKVLQSDIDNLQLHKLRFNKAGKAVLGEFTSYWHHKHTPDYHS